MQDSVLHNPLANLGIFDLYLTCYLTIVDQYLIQSYVLEKVLKLTLGHFILVHCPVLKNLKPCFT